MESHWAGFFSKSSASLRFSLTPRCCCSVACGSSLRPLVVSRSDRPHFCDLSSLVGNVRELAI